MSVARITLRMTKTSITSSFHIWHRSVTSVFGIMYFSALWSPRRVQARCWYFHLMHIHMLTLNLLRRLCEWWTWAQCPRSLHSHWFILMTRFSKDDIRMISVTIDDNPSFHDFCHRGFDPVKCIHDTCQSVACNSMVNISILRNSSGWSERWSTHFVDLTHVKSWKSQSQSLRCCPMDTTSITRCISRSCGCHGALTEKREIPIFHKTEMRTWYKLSS